jgi:hypothetical protein
MLVNAGQTWPFPNKETVMKVKQIAGIFLEKFGKTKVHISKVPV